MNREITHLLLVSLLPFSENVFQSLFALFCSQTDRQINASYHITSSAEVNMPQKRLAKQARGQRCLLNLDLLRVCSDSCGSGRRNQDVSISLPQISSYISFHSPHVYIIVAFSVSPLFSCMFPYTDEIMALISFQLFKGASGRHSRINPQIFFKAAAERQLDNPAKTPAII